VARVVVVQAARTTWLQQRVLPTLAAVAAVVAIQETSARRAVQA
jgi:hypothetical protein